MNRRQFLTHSLAVGSVAGAGWLAISPDRVHGTEAPETVAFLGEHQAGITTPLPAMVLLVAFDITANSGAELPELFRLLTQRIQFLMTGGTVPSRDPRYPPSDSGILGDRLPADHLSITVSVGASLFDDRFGLAAQKPRHLVTMPAFPNDRLDPDWCHGDLLIQFLADHHETNLHAFRDILKQLAGLVVPRWQITGFQQPDRDPHPHRTTVRNLMGFKDGTANPDPRDTKLMDQLVWVPAQSEEPRWTGGGTYQVVRIIRMFVEFWDRTALEEQQTIMGRERLSGSPLGYRHEEDQPNYARDPQGRSIPRNAHIRLANPRTPATDNQRILRNGFHYALGQDAAGQLNQGLLFMAYQQDLDRGFVSIQNRLNGEPLEEYIQPVGGGYFFVLPGVRDPQAYLAQHLLTRTA